MRRVRARRWASWCRSWRALPGRRRDFVLLLALFGTGVVLSFVRIPAVYGWSLGG